MFRTFTLIAALVGLSIVASSFVASTSNAAIVIPGLVNETFDSAASTTANGWTGFQNTTGGHNFGFSNTNNTGGQGAGEAGGDFSRTGTRAWYGDTSPVAAAYTRSTAFLASGEFDATDVTFNMNHQIGHFDSTNTSTATFDAVGFEVLENNNVNNIRMRAAIYFSNGSSVFGNMLTVGGFPNSDRLWSYSWNPTGGVNSLGRLTYTINGTGGGTSFVDLSAGENGLDFALDAFGMLSRAASGTDGSTPGTYFIDNATYSHFIAIPEPGTLAILGLGACGLALAARRRR